MFLIRPVHTCTDRRSDRSSVLRLMSWALNGVGCRVEPSTMMMYPTPTWRSTSPASLRQRRPRAYYPAAPDVRLPVPPRTPPPFAPPPSIGEACKLACRAENESAGPRRNRRSATPGWRPAAVAGAGIKTPGADVNNGVLRESRD